MPEFLALPGCYNALFLHAEPVSTIFPALMTWFYPGANWFHHQLVPTSSPSPALGLLDPRTSMAIHQLGYFLLGLLSTLVFRAVRDSLPNNPEAQERILGASFSAMAIADVTHILLTFIGLPSDLRYNFAAWNSMTHGNITFVIFLFLGRLAWFFGIGRTRYYFGQSKAKRP